MKRVHSIGAFVGLALSLAACAHGPAEDSAAVVGEPAKQAEAKQADVKSRNVAAAPAKAAMLAKAAPAAAPAAGAPAAAGAKEEKCDHCDNCDGKGAEAENEGETQQQIAIAGAPSRGPASAPVTVVVFSDFQCPFCSRAEATVKELEAAYPGKIRFVFKNSPLPFHQSARLAAKAALAANEQGKFWEYHDMMFAHQQDLDRASLERYASELGLDLRRFRAALDDARLETTIENDITEAHHLGVQGTPSFFINGRNIKGARPLEVFRAKVDQALAER